MNLLIGATLQANNDVFSKRFNCSVNV